MNTRRTHSEIYNAIYDLGEKCFQRVDYVGFFKDFNDAKMFDCSGSKELAAAEKLARLLAPENSLDEFDKDFYGILNEFSRGFKDAYINTYYPG